MTGPSRRSVIAGAGAVSLGLTGCANAQMSRLELWNNATGPHLRGAVLAQRRVFPELDGTEFLGSGAVGVPVTDAALQELAARGANMVILSHPGTVAEWAPYEPDLAVEDHLNDLVRRCELAGLYVVIGFRTGPGRSEFTFHRGDAGSWFPASMINDDVWRSTEAHDGWDMMWRRTAMRYRDRANIAGYLLMVEPNANQAAPGPDGGDLDQWDPSLLAAQVAGTPADWPALARRLSAVIREHDTETPILVSPDGYAHQSFAGLVDVHSVPGQVLAVHDYSPRGYTHQGRGAAVGFNAGEAEYAPPDAERWMMGEFGCARWAPDAPRYMRRRVASLERAGAAWAMFRWDSGWRSYEDRENMFNPVYGSNPDATQMVPDAPLVQTLQGLWGRNHIRPRPFLRR
tara:strand:+ start:17192 stop:18394 length:1203 start_codon:yes stop_codon:yes gene_type:complete